MNRDVKLLQLGSVDTGGSGCICPESVLLKSLVTNILLARNEVVLMDMYAGVEHLGRATEDSVDAMLIVAEPTARSLGTAAQIRDLAGDIKITRLFLIGSKVRDESDRELIRKNSPGLEVLGFISADPAVLEADRNGLVLYDLAPQLASEAQAIVAALDQIIPAK